VREAEWVLEVGTWVVVLGVVGFVAGFFGPIALRPEANQGPLVGIFITGPGGAAAGLVLGVLLRALHVSARHRWMALLASAALLGLGTLFFCLPPPDTVGRLLEARVVACDDPAELTDEAVRDWERRVANATWAKVRPDWQQEVPGMLRAYPGVVVTLDVARENPILRHRKPWNAGRTTADGWRSPREPSQRYFADPPVLDCVAGDPAPRRLYVRSGQGSRSWPPDDLPNLLDLARVEPVPAAVAALADR
jgi:hypothetical protein